MVTISFIAVAIGSSGHGPVTAAGAALSTASVVVSSIVVSVSLDWVSGGSERVDDVVNAYLLDLESPPADARCSL
jgi:hypothetical protein